MPDSALQSAVATAKSRPAAIAALGQIYADLAGATAVRKPRCDASGRCCNFDAFGHRLYVTTLELGAFVLELPRPGTAATSAQSLPVLTGKEPGCVFQVDGLCSVHAIRPFGCRIFFCDPTAESWQQDQYELLHGRIKKLHAEYSIPYIYVEWRQAMAELGLTHASKPK